MKGLRLISMILTMAAITGSTLPAICQFNLVQNPSFENYDTCPPSGLYIGNAVPWFQPNNYGNSTDYFNACSVTASVPNNFAGYQAAHTGYAYAGVGILGYATDSFGREYLEGILQQTLDSGKKYCFSLYTSRGDIGQVSCEFGIYFSSDTLQYFSSSWGTINVVPQLAQTNSVYVDDQVNWVLSEWIYEANGGEQYFTFGTFNNYPNLNYNCTVPFCAGAYYYVDDVSMVELPELNAGVNDTICISDSVQLSGSISMQWPGMQFEWLPHNGLADPFSLSTMAAPLASTTYTLHVTCATCDVPCLDDVKDSVRIFVVPQFSIVPLDSICFGESVQLNVTMSEQWVGLEYEWTPHAGLDDPFIFNPVASPGETTTYTLSIACSGCTDTCYSNTLDTCHVFVNRACSAAGNLVIPTWLESNEQWVILNLPAESAVRIIDVRGRLIYRSDNYQNDWVASVSRATYVYEVRLKTGEVLEGKLMVME